ncbi:hypothetical protein GF406_25275, partial [candidate division KSB1 bacterium]|nr:hypothetical protein [candidate division KSB1 bacterium]
MRRIILCIIWSTLNVFAQPQTVPFSDKGAFQPDVKTLGPRDAPIYHYVIDDFDRDSIDEIGVLRQHQDVGIGLAVYEQDETVYSFEGLVNIAHPASFDQLRRHHIIYPLENHPIYRYAVIYVGKKNIHIYLLNGRFEKMNSLTAPKGIDRTNTGQWNGSAGIAGLWDANQDGKPDLWIKINSGSDARPRCLLAIDSETDSSLLRLDVAPMASKFEIVNFNNGDDVKIVAKLTGAGHGEFFGPFRRDESYLAIFSPDGTLIKSWEYAGINT